MGKMLSKEEVAALAGVIPETITGWASRSRRKKRERRPLAPGDLPVPVRHVRQKITRTDGVVVVVNAAQWDEDQIMAWLPHRRGPGGRERASLNTKAAG